MFGQLCSYTSSACQWQNDIKSCSTNRPVLLMIAFDNKELEVSIHPFAKVCCFPLHLIMSSTYITPQIEILSITLKWKKGENVCISRSYHHGFILPYQPLQLILLIMNRCSGITDWLLIFVTGQRIMFW